MHNWLGRIRSGRGTAAPAVALLGVVAGSASAQTSAPSELVPFADFLAGLSSARAGDFVAQPSPASPSQAAPPVGAAFEEIRAHLLKVYRGQDVRRSFLQDGQTFDCIPLDQQPAVRLRGVTSFAVPPPFAPAESTDAPGTPDDMEPTLPAYAPKLHCPRGSFAMPRMTLEKISRFGSLRHFFEKGPNGAGHAHDPEKATAEPNTNGHAYAYAYQYVNNWGGQSSESLDDPKVETSRGEVFSLMQHWYVGGSGDGLQTAEVGWVVSPPMFGDGHAHLFAYWTADNYQATGCWNYSCGAFVQSAQAPISLGQQWENYSVPGSRQHHITIGFYLFQGNWWLGYRGGWVGYYPGWLYGGGQLASNATAIQFGTESYGADGWWPPEGSGYFAPAGRHYAAFQRKIYYRDGSGTLIYPALTPVAQSPGCYNDTYPIWGGSTWQYFFFLGGPGGTGC